MKKQKNIPRLVIAGPGAGKTHNMVNEIARVLPKLKSNRILAAITYTNAATDSIRTKLHQIVHIRPNVFIGTIHRFLNQFILLPYATLFDFLPMEKTFLELNIDAIVNEQLGNKKNDKEQRAIIRAEKIKNLLKDGKVPSEQIVAISAKLIKNKRVRTLVSRRIQYLFIDEFQDVDTSQFRVFEEIRKTKNTTMYVVGDPEQYVSNYTYGTRSKKHPEFHKIPFNRFKEHAQQPEKILENHRSFTEIVNFINQFHTEIQQTAIKGRSGQTGVFFIPDTDIDTIISTYRTLTKMLENNAEQKPTYFYLGVTDRIFKGIEGKYGLTPISNDRVKPRSILEESLQLLSMVIGLNQKQIREKYDLDRMSYRKLGIRLIRAITEGQIQQKDELIFFVKNDLNLTIEDQYPGKLGDQLRKLQHLLCQNNPESCRHQYTSIRKAKGLEADAVLVIARTENELNGWLTTEREQRYQDKNDTCRLGFVGFSRAKQILCIACKKKIGDEVKKRLVNLGIQIISDKKKNNQLALFDEGRI